MLLTTCTSHPEYEIVQQSTQDHVAWAKVNLLFKPDQDQLLEIAEDVQDDLGSETGYTILFAIPSAYPDFPENPWARYDLFADDKTTSRIISYYGTSSEEQEKLKAKAPTRAGNVVGRWYLYDPTRERAMYIIKSDSAIWYVENVFYSETLEDELYTYKNEEQNPVYPGNTCTISTNEMLLTQQSDSVYVSISGDSTLTINTAGDLLFNTSNGYPSSARKY